MLLHGLLCLWLLLPQGKVATAARESKGNFLTKIGRQIANPHKKIFKVRAVLCCTVAACGQLHHITAMPSFSCAQMWPSAL